MKYFIANWKANKNLEEAEEWLNIFDAKLLSDPAVRTKLEEDKIKIIIAPPHPFISGLLRLISGYKKKYSYYRNIHLAAQDVSHFEKGSFTGEVTAYSLQGIVDYVIVGHSERRRLLNENNDVILKKIQLAKKYFINPILCVRNKEDLVSADLDFVTFEPEHAIGTGNNEPLSRIIEVKKSLNLPSETNFLYGGSVNSTDIQEYLKNSELNGFMIGTASQNPLDFIAAVSSV